MAEEDEVTTNDGDEHSSHGLGPGELLFDTASLLPILEFDINGRAQLLGRDVYDVTAVPTVFPEGDEEAEHMTHTASLGRGADEYCLLVDIERGVLLRAEARLDGEPFRVIEMTEIAFDETLAPEAFRPPARGVIEPAPQHHIVALKHLPQLVSFTIYVPEHPENPASDAMVAPPFKGAPQQVHISYGGHSPGGTGSVYSLTQSGKPLPEPLGIVWSPRGGIRIGSDARGDVVAVVQRERTHIQIHAHNLTADEVLALCHTLVPLPSSAAPSL